MDYKRNKKYFSPTYKRNMNILGIIAAVLAVVTAAVWWWLLFYTVVEILAIVLAILAIAAFTVRPKESYLIDQIEEQIADFRSSTADKLKLPDDFDENSLLVWGFCPGNIEKASKSGVQTDRVCYTLLYLKRSELYVRTKRLGLVAEEESIEESRLPIEGLAVSFSDDERTMLLAEGDQKLELPIRDKDYNLEQFLEKVAHRQKK